MSGWQRTKKEEKPEERGKDGMINAETRENDMSERAEEMGKEMAAPCTGDRAANEQRVDSEEMTNASAGGSSRGRLRTMTAAGGATPAPHTVRQP